MMVTVEDAVDLAVPADEAYRLWTDFERYPRFMAGVESVRALDERHLEWTGSFGGAPRTWTAALTERAPGRALAWSSVSGPAHAGVVDITPLEDGGCRVTLRLDFEAEDDAAAERAAGDLARFGRLAQAGAPAAPAAEEPGGPAAADLVGLPAFDREGIEVGTVAAVHLEPGTPYARHLVVASSGPLGTKLSLVPAAGAVHSELWNGVSLPYEAERIAEAPALGGEDAPTPEEEREAARWFGAP